MIESSRYIDQQTTTERAGVVDGMPDSTLNVQKITFSSVVSIGFDVCSVSRHGQVIIAFWSSSARSITGM